MKSSGLFQLIMDVAEQERSGRELTLDYVYLAMVKVVHDPSLREGHEINEEELQKLSDLLEKKGTPISPEDLEKRVHEAEHLPEDSAQAKEFVRWVSFGNIQADQALNKLISDARCVKEYINKDAQEDEEPTDRMAAILAKLRSGQSSGAGSASSASSSGQREGMRQGSREREAKQEEEQPAQKEEEDLTMKGQVLAAAHLRAALQDVVMGQDAAIRVFVEGYFRAEIRAQMDQKRRGVRGSYLFAGAPGVGKTFLADTAIEALGLPNLILDMTSYTTYDAVNDLVGTPESIHGTREGTLTGFVKRNPHCIILVDEVEKAAPRVLNLFLQVLDEGKLHDEKTKADVSFLDAHIIFTTNAGKQLYTDTDQRKMSTLPRAVVLDALKKDVNPMTGQPFFSAPLLSRLATGTVIMFDNLDASDMITITQGVLAREEQMFTESYGIESEGAPSLAQSLILSLGGHSDGRQTTAEARRFFASEIFELMRLLNERDGEGVFDTLKKIRWKIDREDLPAEVSQLYEDTEGTTTLIVGEGLEGREEALSKAYGRVLTATDVAGAREILQKYEITMAFVNYYMKPDDPDAHFLNVEDIHSEGRRVFEMIRSEYAAIPVYVWDTEERALNSEERLSLAGRGAEEILECETGDEERLMKILEYLGTKVCRQRAADTLALRHQVLDYETVQDISLDRDVATITMTDQRLTQAIEAEDQKAVLSADEKPNVHWDDIIVSEKNKQELQYFIDYLKNPRKFRQTGAKVPKGLLMYGPPGTGKTSLAKVAATESDVTFLAVSGDQFLNKWVGTGPQRVREMFATARKYAPAILFIDEIDTIGRRRSEEPADGYRPDDILNALLAEMDGFRTAIHKPVFVMAATNLGGRAGAEGALDPALVRRFDAQIAVDLPDKEGRIKLLKLFIGRNPNIHISDEEIESLAIRSSGMSPANLEGVVDTAVRDAIQSGKDVDDKMIDGAFERYSMGEEKKWDPDELMQTARHEGGHALISYLTGDKPSYLTIVARGSHGGYMMHGDNEKKGSYNKQELLDRICTSLGGRAAEQVYYGDVSGTTTGPSADLRNASAIARRMICEYGMYEEFGIRSIPGGEALGEQMRQKIDDQINIILIEQLARARKMIEDNRDRMDKLVSVLMDKQHMTAGEIEAVLG